MQSSSRGNRVMSAVVGVVASTLGLAVPSAVAQVCGVPTAGNCLLVHETPGCADAACCSAVCDIDPYCCTTKWDYVCRQMTISTPACAVEPPSNDEPLGATFVGAGFVSFNTVGATDSADVSIPASCGGLFGDEIRRDVWFEYRAGRTGVVTMSTCPGAGDDVGAEFDPILVVRDPVSLAVIACNDEAAGCGGYAAVSLAVTAGERLLVQVGGHDEYIGVGGMQITETGVLPAAPINDRCADAIEIGLDVPVSFDLLAAARDDASCDDALVDVWYRIPAQGVAGALIVQICGGDGVARLEIARRECLGERICGALAACEQDELPEGVDVAVSVGADETILVRVASVPRGVGEVVATFVAQPACPADITGDGDVGAADLSLLLARWGQAGASDIDGDGDTSAADLSLLLEAWGLCD